MLSYISYYTENLINFICTKQLTNKRKEELLTIIINQSKVKIAK